MSSVINKNKKSFIVHAAPLDNQKNTKIRGDGVSLKSLKS